MIRRITALLALLAIGETLALGQGYINFSAEPSTNTVGALDDFLINSWVGTRYVTRRISGQNLSAGLLSLGGASGGVVSPTYAGAVSLLNTNNMFGGTFVGNAATATMANSATTASSLAGTITPNQISQAGASNNYVLSWLGDHWGPASVVGTYVTVTNSTSVPVLNVKGSQFGAYGDGVHDDTAAIQGALNMSATNPAAAAVVYIPKGIYKITHITIPAYSTSTEMLQDVNPTIYGDGPRMSILWSTETNGNIFEFKTSSTNGTARLIMPNFRDFQVCGPGVADPTKAATKGGVVEGLGYSTVGFWLGVTNSYAADTSAYGLNFDRLSIIGCATGMLVSNTVSLLLNNCDIWYCRDHYGVFYRCDSMKIAGCRFGSNGRTPSFNTNSGYGLVFLGPNAGTTIDGIELGDMQGHLYFGGGPDPVQDGPVGPVKIIGGNFERCYGTNWMRIEGFAPSTIIAPKWQNVPQQTNFSYISLVNGAAQYHTLINPSINPALTDYNACPLFEEIDASYFYYPVYISANINYSARLLRNRATFMDMPRTGAGQKFVASLPIKKAQRAIKFDLTPDTTPAPYYFGNCAAFSTNASYYLDQNVPYGQGWTGLKHTLTFVGGTGASNYGFNLQLTTFSYTTSGQSTGVGYGPLVVSGVNAGELKVITFTTTFADDTNSRMMELLINNLGSQTNPIYLVDWTVESQ